MINIASIKPGDVSDFSLKILLGIILLSSGVSTVVLAQEEQLRISLDDAQQINESEQRLKQIIQAAMDEDNGLLNTRKTVTLSNRGATMMALDKNLSLRRGMLSDQIAQDALTEARAVFDPVLTLSLAYDRTQANTRIETVDRFQSATTVDENGNNVLVIDAALDPRNPVVIFTEPREEGERGDAQILANQKPITGNDDSWTMGVGLEQALPWGGAVQINYQAINKDTHFINNPNVFTDNPNPPLNLIGFGSYKRPWVSQLLASLQMPLPGTKDFGQYAPQTLNKRKADLNRQSASFAIKGVINKTLKQVDTAYWDLVESALAVEAGEESRIAAEKQLASAKRLYSAQSANNFDIAQAEMTMAGSVVSILQIWSNYLKASDQLAVLLDMPANSLIVPEGYSTEVAAVESVSQTSDNAIEQHPDLQAEKFLSELQKIESDAGRNRTAPDLTFNVELGLRQSNLIYGYKSFADSLSSVFDPDISTQSLGLSYSLPLGNRALKAANRASAAGYNQSKFNLQATRNNLDSNLLNAEAGLEAAQQRLLYLTEAFHFAQSSYTKALAQQRRRDVREFELAGQHARLLQARLDYIAALISIKRAETALLEAQGILNQKYASKISTLPVDQKRLSLLQGLGRFEFFLPAGNVQ